MHCVYARQSQGHARGGAVRPMLARQRVGGRAAGVHALPAGPLCGRCGRRTVPELHRRAVFGRRRHRVRRLCGRHVQRGAGGVFGGVLKLQRGHRLARRRGDVAHRVPELLGGLGVSCGILCVHRLPRGHLQRGTKANQVSQLRAGQVFDRDWDVHGLPHRRPRSGQGGSCEQRGSVHVVCAWLLHGTGGHFRLRGVRARDVLFGPCDRLHPLSARHCLCQTRRRRSKRDGVHSLYARIVGGHRLLRVRQVHAWQVPEQDGRHERKRVPRLRRREILGRRPVPMLRLCHGQILLRRRLCLHKLHGRDGI